MAADEAPSIAAQQAPQLPNSALHASALNDPLLEQEWFAAAWSREIEPGKLLPRRVMATDLVLWRSQEGLHCWRDLCVHRGARLSLGAIRPAAAAAEMSEAPRDCLICPYHAWEYAPSGECVRIPAHPEMTPPARARVQSFQVRERYGVVWVAFGQTRGTLPEFPLAESAGFRTILAGLTGFMR